MSESGSPLSASAACFAAATTAFLCASGLRRRSPQEREPEETGHPA
jgi:hypothetical protein